MVVVGLIPPDERSREARTARSWWRCPPLGGDLVAIDSGIATRVPSLFCNDLRPFGGIMHLAKHVRPAARARQSEERAMKKRKTTKITVDVEELRRAIEEEVRAAFCGAGEADALASQVAPDVASEVVHRLRPIARQRRK